MMTYSRTCLNVHYIRRFKMTYTFVYRKGGAVLTTQLTLEEGVDLSQAISSSGDIVLKELDADNNSPLFAIVK